MLRIYGILKEYNESTNLYLKTYIQPIQKLMRYLGLVMTLCTMTEATIHNLKSVANDSDTYLKNNTLI